MNAPPTLRRSVSAVLVTFYGLGTILGAGIYVLIGAVVAEAGAWTPLAFVLAAAIAAVTALSYAELVRRLPLCGGEALYVEAAFGRPALTLAVGLAIVFCGVVSSATIARGFAAYLALFAPLPAALAIILMVSGLVAVAVRGIEASVWLASAMTVVEIGGLLLVLAVGGGSVEPAAALAALSPPGDLHAAAGIAAGAFLAFYAFLGFEDMINLAEEVQDVERALPRAIVTALAVATVLYVAVALVAVSAVPLAAIAGHEAPLAVIVAARGLDPRVIAAVSVVAVMNGALVQIIKAARVLYGLARAGHLPRLLARIEPATRTPAVATVAVGAGVLACALGFDLVQLAALTSAVTLLVFAAANAALIALRRRERRRTGVVDGGPALPWLGLLLSLVLLAALCLLD
ncbi:MAG: amino acid permease [Gammaproteobacteria bacterium]|nr:amino acid permease [Gammaproteobacteria bacterium]MCP5199166.1 amino acid permease [Gammaproteobacteria bacterium]